jgi:co-chaperonin GroES (HSP10)
MRAVKGTNPLNESGFAACGHNVLLITEEIERKTESGILLMDKTAEAEENHSVYATIVEIGEDCWSDKVSDFASVGDVVLVGQYTGKFQKSPFDGKKYRFVKDLDIISRITKPMAVSALMV